MSTPIEGLPRRVIPRWRDFRSAAALGELSSFEKIPPREPIPSTLGPLVRLWRDQQTDIVAGELLSVSWLERNFDLAREAAKFLLRPRSEARELTKDFARTVLAEVEEPEKTGICESVDSLDADAIKSIRHALRLYSHDAIGWCELARYYATIGKHKKARRAILTALRLAPENRFIIRSASRCLIHLGDVEAAFAILNAAERTRFDPWLLAANVSVGNILDKPSRFYKRAKEMSKVSSLPFFHRAELMAALGTLELSDGKQKEARRMFGLSLTQPTENVLAQVWWAKSQVNIRVEPKLLDQPRSFEANTRALVQVENWEGASVAAKQWLADEPFSSSPAIQLSFFHNVVFDEHSRAEAVLRKALIANPDDLLVQNNLAFALACQGKLRDAEDVLAKAKTDSAPAPRVVALTATEGLIRFREGNVSQGRILYESAIQLAKKFQLNREKALATIYLAREEKRANTEEAASAILTAEEVGEAYEDPVFKLVLKTLRDGPLVRKKPDES